MRPRPSQAGSTCTGGATPHWRTCWLRQPKKPARSLAGNLATPNSTGSWSTLGLGTKISTSTEQMPATHTRNSLQAVPDSCPSDRPADGGLRGGDLPRQLLHRVQVQHCPLDRSSPFELIRHDVTEPIKLEVDRIWPWPARPLGALPVQSGEDRQDQLPGHLQHAGAG